MSGGRPRRSREEQLSELFSDVTLPGYTLGYQSGKPWCDRTGRDHFWECSTHGLFRGAVPCLQLDCETCAPKVKRKRGRLKYKQFGGVSLGAFVFTLPGSFRPHIGVKQAAELRRAVAATMKRYLSEVHGGRGGFYIACHPAGDKRPGLWTPHYHVGVPLLIRDECTGALVALDYKRTEEELHIVKTMWAEVLTEIADLLALDDVVRDESGLVVPNVHYSFRVEPGKIHHRIGYDCRSFPKWSAGGFSVGLARVTSYGLASSRAGDDDWRAAVSAEIDSEQSCCPVDGCEHELEHVGCHEFGTPEWATMGDWARQLDGDGALVPSRGPPPGKVMTPHPDDDIPY